MPATDKRRETQPKSNLKRSETREKKMDKEVREIWFNPHATEMRESQADFCDCECQLLRDDRVQQELQRIAKVYSQVNTALEVDDEEAQSKGCCGGGSKRKKTKEQGKESKPKSDRAASKNKHKEKSQNKRDTSTARKSIGKRESNAKKERSQMTVIHRNCRFKTHEEAKRYKELKSIYTRRPKTRPTSASNKKKKEAKKKEHHNDDRCPGSSSDDSTNIRADNQAKKHKSRKDTENSSTRPAPRAPSNNPQTSTTRQQKREGSKNKEKKKKSGIGCCGGRAQADDDNEAYKPVSRSSGAAQAYNRPSTLSRECPFTPEELALLEKLRATYARDTANKNERKRLEPQADKADTGCCGLKKKKRTPTEDESNNTIYSQYTNDPSRYYDCRCAENDATTLEQKYTTFASSSKVFTYDIQSCDPESCRFVAQQYDDNGNGTLGPLYDTQKEESDGMLLTRMSESAVLHEEHENKFETKLKSQSDSAVTASKTAEPLIDSELENPGSIGRESLHELAQNVPSQTTIKNATTEPHSASEFEGPILNEKDSMSADALKVQSKTSTTSDLPNGDEPSEMGENFKAPNTSNQSNQTKPSTACCPIRKKNKPKKSEGFTNLRANTKSEKRDIRIAETDIKKSQILVQDSQQQKSCNISRSCWPFDRKKQRLDSREMLSDTKKEETLGEEPSKKQKKSCCSLKTKNKPEESDVYVKKSATATGSIDKEVEPNNWDDDFNQEYDSQQDLQSVPNEALTKSSTTSLLMEKEQPEKIDDSSDKNEALDKKPPSWISLQTIDIQKISKQPSRPPTGKISEGAEKLYSNQTQESYVSKIDDSENQPLTTTDQNNVSQKEFNKFQEPASSTEIYNATNSEKIKPTSCCPFGKHRKLDSFVRASAMNGDQEKQSTLQWSSCFNKKSHLDSNEGPHEQTEIIVEKILSQMAEGFSKVTTGESLKKESAKKPSDVGEKDLRNMSHRTTSCCPRPKTKELKISEQKLSKVSHERPGSLKQQALKTKPKSMKNKTKKLSVSKSKPIKIERDSAISASNKASISCCPVGMHKQSEEPKDAEKTTSNVSGPDLKDADNLEKKPFKMTLYFPVERNGKSQSGFHIQEKPRDAEMVRSNAKMTNYLLKKPSSIFSEVKPIDSDKQPSNAKVSSTPWNKPSSVFSKEKPLDNEKKPFFNKSPGSLKQKRSKMSICCAIAKLKNIFEKEASKEPMSCCPLTVKHKTADSERKYSAIKLESLKKKASNTRMSSIDKHDTSQSAYEKDEHRNSVETQNKILVQIDNEHDKKKVTDTRTSCCPIFNRDISNSLFGTKQKATKRAASKEVPKLLKKDSFKNIEKKAGINERKSSTPSNEQSTSHKTEFQKLPKKSADKTSRPSRTRERKKLRASAKDKKNVSKPSNLSYSEALYNDLENVFMQRFPHQEIFALTKDYKPNIRTKSKKQQESLTKAQVVNVSQKLNDRSAKQMENSEIQTPNFRYRSQRKEKPKKQIEKAHGNVAELSMPPAFAPCYGFNEAEIRPTYLPEYVLGQTQTRGVSMSPSRQVKYAVILSSNAKRKSYKDPDKAPDINYFYGHGLDCQN